MVDSWKSMAIFVDDKGKGPLKDDKSEVTGIKILDDLEKRIEKVEKILNKAKEKMLLKKGKEKMVMKRGKTSFEKIASVFGFVWSMVRLEPENSPRISPQGYPWWPTELA
nr:hypothetical protein [Tanacetum cinerariifolium]